MGCRPAGKGVCELVGSRQRSLDFLELKQVLVRQLASWFCGSAVPDVGKVNLFRDLCAKVDVFSWAFEARAGHGGFEAAFHGGDET